MNEIERIITKLQSIEPQAHWREGTSPFGFGSEDVPYVERVFESGARVRLYYLGSQEVRAEMTNGDRMAYSGEMVLKGRGNSLSESSIKISAEIIVEMGSWAVENNWINNSSGSTLQGSLLTMWVSNMDEND